MLNRCRFLSPFFFFINRSHKRTKSQMALTLTQTQPKGERARL